MLNSLIILIAVINIAYTQDTPEVDDVAILSGLASSSLECSLKFSRNFIASNEDIASAIEDMLDVTREPKPTREASDVTREPCEEGEEDCHRGGHRHRGDGHRHREDGRGRGRDQSDSVEDVETPEDEGAETPELRRNLGRNRDNSVVDPLEADSTAEPCEGEDCTRRQRRRDRRRDRREGRDSDSTKEPCDKDEEAAQTDAPVETEEPETVQLRRNLRDRRRRATREPLADGQTREPRPTREPRDNTREPCEEGEDCRRNRRRGDKPCDDEDETTNEPEEIASPLLRRLLRRGDEDADVNPLDNTAEPCEGEDCERRQRRREKRERRGRDADSTKEPCDRDEANETDAPAETEEPETVELRRNLRNRNRPTREPLAEGETREPRGTKEPCEGEDCERRQRRRERRDRRGRDSDSTQEPCDRDEADGTDASAETEEPETVELRRNLRNRNRPTREPLADGETREPRGTKEPCDVTREPCDPTQEDCSRGGKNRRRRRRRDDETTAAPTEDDIVVRRMLRRGGRRGRGLDAVISGGTVEIAGIVGTVEFGDVSQELESIPLTLTIGETIFTCDVEVRRDGVSCRASSEDNFKVRVGCAIPAEPEL